jgi:hypothetical protein
MKVEKGDNQMSKNLLLKLKNKLISKIRLRDKKGNYLIRGEEIEVIISNE